jgi:hypothetical protein
VSKPRNLQPESVPEVADFVEADDRYQEFKNKHRKIFEQLIALAEDRNAKLEAADKALRVREASCGPFQLLGKPTTKINADKLIEQVGKKNFFELGGTEQTVVTYKIDEATFERAVASGVVPDEVLEEVRTTTCRFSKPDKVVIP